MVDPFTRRTLPVLQAHLHYIHDDNKYGQITCTYILHASTELGVIFIHVLCMCSMNGGMGAWLTCGPKCNWSVIVESFYAPQIVIISTKHHHMHESIIGIMLLIRPHLYTFLLATRFIHSIWNGCTAFAQN